MSSLSNMSSLNTFFIICAAAGGFGVVVRLVTQFMGAEDGDFDDADEGFRILSLLGLSSFFLMLGLVGFALHAGSGAGRFLSMAGGVGAGVGTVWVIGKVFRAGQNLESSGNIDLGRTVGCAGKVYLRIPAEGAGIVSVSVAGRLREYDAKSMDGETLETGQAVRVVWVDGSVLVVERI